MSRISNFNNFVYWLIQMYALLQGAFLLVLYILLLLRGVHLSPFNISGVFFCILLVCFGAWALKRRHFRINKVGWLATVVAAVIVVAVEATNLRPSNPQPAAAVTEMSVPSPTVPSEGIITVTATPNPTVEGGPLRSAVDVAVEPATATETPIPTPAVLTLEGSLQDAVNNAPGEVTIKVEGTLFVDTLIIPSGKSITLEGPATIEGMVTINGALTAKDIEFILPGEGKLLHADGGVRLNLINCSLKSKKPGIGRALEVACGAKAMINNTEIKDFGQAEYTVGCATTRFENVEFKNLGQGIYACSADVQLENCSFSGISSMAVDINCRSNVHVANCRFSNSQGGIWSHIDEPAKVEIENCVFSNLKRYAVLITEWGKGVSLNQNLFLNNGGNAVREHLLEDNRRLREVLESPLPPVVYLDLEGTATVSETIRISSEKEVHLKGDGANITYSGKDGGTLFEVEGNLTVDGVNLIVGPDRKGVTLIHAKKGSDLHLDSTLSSGMGGGNTAIRADLGSHTIVYGRFCRGLARPGALVNAGGVVEFCTWGGCQQEPFYCSQTLVYDPWKGGDLQKMVDAVPDGVKVIIFVDSSTLQGPLFIRKGQSVELAPSYPFQTLSVTGSVRVQGTLSAWKAGFLEPVLLDGAEAQLLFPE